MFGSRPLTNNVLQAAAVVTSVDHPASSSPGLITNSYLRGADPREEMGFWGFGVLFF